MIDMSVLKFAEKYPLPGFYIDVRGEYCLHLGRNLISIFYNEENRGLDICVDTISNDGFIDECLEWETPKTEKELLSMIRNFTNKYGEQ